MSSDKPLPSNVRAEIRFARSLLTSDCCKMIPVYANKINPAFFYDSGCRKVYEITLKMQSAGECISLETFDNWMQRENLSDTVKGAIDEVITSGDITINPELDAKEIISYHSRRNAIVKTQRMQNLLFDASIEHSGLLPQIREITDSLEIDSKNLEDQIFIPVWENEPEDLPPLAELSNVNILTRGNIAGIIALPGAGKSSLLGAACASAYNPMSDTLGLRFSENASILYLDTERCNQDHHRAWRQFMNRCDIPQGQPAPENIQWACIRAMGNISDRVHYLLTKIDSDHSPDIVLVDCITDFMMDPNDLQEAVKIITMLSAIAHKRNNGIILTMHPNPNSEKARGHIGSEIMRKAESVILIQKQDEISTITTGFSMGKNRNGSTDIKHSFKWDNDLKMHVSCDVPIETKGKKAKEWESVTEILTSKEYLHSELVKLISDQFHKSKPTATRWITGMTDKKVLIKNDNGTYSLNKPQGQQQNDWINE